jgi:hypothetical protein
MQGLVWLDETKNMDFSLFKNYKNGLSNYLDSKISLVNDLNDVSNFRTIFVVDEHYYPHREFILAKEFIDIVNKLGIKIVIFNTEKIFRQPFKHNLEIQKSLSKFENKVQILSDAYDIKKLGSPFVNKQLLSKEFKFKNSNSFKKEELLFLGQIDGRAYENRRRILKKIENYINVPLKIENSKRKLNYKEFLEKINEYKFILNPLGNGGSEFLNVRYYETLFLNSIPVQQITKRMLNNYEELNSSISLNFQKLNELKKIDFKNINSLNQLNALKSPYLEDYLYEVRFKEIIK